jgi:hypothetical protein
MSSLVSVRPETFKNLQEKYATAKLFAHGKQAFRKVRGTKQNTSRREERPAAKIFVRCHGRLRKFTENML